MVTGGSGLTAWIDSQGLSPSKIPRDCKVGVPEAPDLPMERRPNEKG